MDTPQTVAQAVQAATQQAQRAASHLSSPAIHHSPVQTSAIDNLTCQWQGCGERCDNAEALYDHVCERHVGRKSTNNLNLTCQWGACRTTTVKRDHITSHIRVHVPLKPHKCDLCGKAFKRPQDLKKHVKTHADDTVLNSPQNGSGRSNGTAAPSYYGTNHDSPLGNPYPSYQPSMANGTNGASYAQATGAQYGQYGSVSYPNNSAVADIQSLDTRKRAIEALNDFLGDIKRRVIDPGNYYDVGQRLGQSNALPLPVGGTGYNTGYNNSSYGANYSTASLLESFNNGTLGNNSAGNQAGVATHGYSLPLPNARTKNDLQDIDRFLEQLQATVYETSRGYDSGNAAAAAGEQQLGLHAQFAGDFNLGNNHQYRQSHSPPSNFHNHLSNHGMVNGSGMNGLSSTSSGLDTPALTPASVSSYASSGQSPMSSHSRASFGSGSGSMYPNLPAVTGMSDLGSNYPTTTSAPASSLASGFEGLGDGRRYSGGRLQRQAPTQNEQDTEMGEADDPGSRTPKASDSARPKSKGNSSLDPALRGEDEKMPYDSTSGSAPALEVEDKRQEEWVENIRTIEALRRWVGDRLKAGDFEDGESDHHPAVSTSSVSSSDDVDMKTVAALVAEKLAGAAAEAERMDARTQDASRDVKYPSLPTAA